jgi:hypothetical protein
MPPEADLTPSPRRTAAPAPGRRIDIEALNRLVELADYVVPFALRVVCDLGVADHLRDGPRSVAALAKATNAHEPSLSRVLRALASRGIFTEVSPGTFDLTRLADLLCSDHPSSMREAFPLLHGDVKAWAHFDYSVRTGRSAFDDAHGCNYWAYLDQHPDENAQLDAAQQAQTRLELRVLTRVYDWASIGTVVDVCGGNGAFIGGLLSHVPTLRGILLDRPPVVARAPEVLAKAGVLDRCEIRGGSFLEGVPAGADAYILKRILYSWPDESAVLFLGHIRRAMHTGSRLLIIEPVLGPEASADAWRYDLRMLALSGSGSRTRAQHEALLARAGMTLTRVVETMMFPIVEARPA